MNYICSCGKYSEITLDNFRAGHRCNSCGTKRAREKLKLSFEYVCDYFKKQGCKLLEKIYINCDIPMEYICECGSISKISFYSFCQGSRCKKCAAERNSGKNHYNYDPNKTEEERNDQRKYPEYIEWRKYVYKRDNWTCQSCEKRKDLNAHHIRNYSSNRELRTDESNGITLCKICHLEFHKKYGKKDNSRQQLDEFLKVSSLCQK